ncbi:C-type lectin-like isoform X2 [Pelodiscus sinensis]
MGPVAFVTLCLLGCLVCSPALAEPHATSCPRGWLNYHGACYGFFAQKTTWYHAEIVCQEHGRRTHLASILNNGENDMLASYVKHHKENTEPVWVGLSDPEHDRFWKWTDRSPAKFTAWQKGQPDPPSKQERCVVLEVPGFNQWHDYPCDRTFPFVCKQESRGKQLAAREGTTTPGQ